MKGSHYQSISKLNRVPVFSFRTMRNLQTLKLHDAAATQESVNYPLESEEAKSGISSDVNKDNTL